MFVFSTFWAELNLAEKASNSSSGSEAKAEGITAGAAGVYDGTTGGMCTGTGGTTGRIYSLVCWGSTTGCTVFGIEAIAGGTAGRGGGTGPEDGEANGLLSGEATFSCTGTETTGGIVGGTIGF